MNEDRGASGCKISNGYIDNYNISTQHYSGNYSGSAFYEWEGPDIVRGTFPCKISVLILL